MGLFVRYVFVVVVIVCFALFLCSYKTFKSCLYFFTCFFSNFFYYYFILFSFHSKYLPCTIYTHNESGNLGIFKRKKNENKLLHSHHLSLKGRRKFLCFYVFFSCLVFFLSIEVCLNPYCRFKLCINVVEDFLWLWKHKGKIYTIFSSLELSFTYIHDMVLQRKKKVFFRGKTSKLFSISWGVSCLNMSVCYSLD